jgi:Spy/CpxP family protein refolding chaperone
MKTSTLHARRMVAGLSLALAGAAAGGAWAAPGGPGGPGSHGMMGHGARGGPGAGGMFEGMLQRLLDRVNATPEQRTQIQQILQAHADERRAQHEGGRALREQAMALFAQPTVDATALEALRQKQLVMHDAASKRMTATMLEISRVLTPEQRKQMADYMAQRRDMMQRHWRERQSIEAPAKS